MTGTSSTHTNSSEGRVPADGDRVHQSGNIQAIVMQRLGNPRESPGVICPVRRVYLEDAGLAMRVIADEYAWYYSDQYNQALLCGTELRQLADKGYRVSQQGNIEALVLQRSGNPQETSEIICPIRRLQLEDAGHTLRVIADEYAWCYSEQYTQALLIGGELRQVADCFQREYYNRHIKETQTIVQRRGQW